MQSKHLTIREVEKDRNAAELGFHQLSSADRWIGAGKTKINAATALKFWKLNKLQSLQKDFARYSQGS